MPHSRSWVNRNAGYCSTRKCKRQKVTKNEVGNDNEEVHTADISNYSSQVWQQGISSVQLPAMYPSHAKAGRRPPGRWCHRVRPSLAETRKCRESHQPIGRPIWRNQIKNSKSRHSSVSITCGFQILINSNDSNKDEESEEKETKKSWNGTPSNLETSSHLLSRMNHMRGIQDKPQTEECICKIHNSSNTRSINTSAGDVANNPEQKWPVMTENMLSFLANPVRAD